MQCHEKWIDRSELDGAVRNSLSDTPHPTYVVGQATPVWTDDSVDSARWISSTDSGGSISGNNTNYYSTTIQVPTGVTSLIGRTAADNGVTDVLVNGVSTGITSTVGFTWQNFTLTDLQPGAANQITFVVDDTGGYATGLIVHFGADRDSQQYDLSRFMYTGQEYDQTTGLYNYGARFYDAKTSRFMNQDPAGEGTNPYAYVMNDPLDRTDPTGMIPRRMHQKKWMIDIWTKGMRNAR